MALRIKNTAISLKSLCSLPLPVISQSSLRQSAQVIKIIKVLEEPEGPDALRPIAIRSCCLAETRFNINFTTEADGLEPPGISEPFCSSLSYPIWDILYCGKVVSKNYDFKKFYVLVCYEVCFLRANDILKSNTHNW